MMTNKSTRKQAAPPPQAPAEQAPQVPADGQQQAAESQPGLNQALQQQVAQAMQPILGDLQQQITQAVRQQMEQTLQQAQLVGQLQGGQPAAGLSPLQVALERARAVVQQVIEWLRRMVQF